MRTLKKLLLRIARIRWLGGLIGWCITHLAHILPLKIVVENDRCIVFHHPSPSYSTHLLAMLKSPAQDVSTITAEQLRSIVEAGNAAVAALNLTAPHILLWTNGGRFQEVRQLHFHIFASENDYEENLTTLVESHIDGMCLREYAAKNLLIVEASLEALVLALPFLLEKYNLNERGYSVFFDISPAAKRSDRIYVRMGEAQ